MTSEVALMNKSAVALAADSATTVTYWDSESGEHKTRFFKGANKIFNLSVRHPVGLMTFATASLQGVPWELIVKAYREHLKEKSFNYLHEYATDFFAFAENQPLMFPSDVQVEQFRIQADRAATSIVRTIISSKEYLEESDEGKKEQIVRDRLNEQAKSVKDAAFIANADQADIVKALKSLDDVILMFENDQYFRRFVPSECVKLLAELGTIGVFKEGFSGLDSTGLVFAGYGNNDYFPKLEVYRARGLILDKLLFAKESEKAIGHKNASDYATLAQAEMIRTFIYGIGVEALVDIDKFFLKHLNAVENDLKKGGKIAPAEDLESLKESAKDNFGADLIDYFNRTHQRPLRRVIGALPIDDLAAFAETLVYMESLKERYTTPDESVSGPIDVAVISKHDGFIWIKRKHYFDPALNPRFAARQTK